MEDTVIMLEQSNLNEEAKHTVRNLIARAAQKTNHGQATPDFVTQMRLHALREQYDENGVVAKLIHHIQKFSGTDSKYKWAKFWASYSVAVQNTAYNPYKLRAIFLSCLDGAAMDHYHAFQAYYMDMTYEQLVYKFKELYDDTKEMSISNVIGIAQGTNEDVLMFRDRLLNEALANAQTPPVKEHIRKFGERETLVINLDYDNDLIKYESRKSENVQYPILHYGFEGGNSC